MFVFIGVNVFLLDICVCVLSCKRVCVCVFEFLSLSLVVVCVCPGNASGWSLKCRSLLPDEELDEMGIRNLGWIQFLNAPFSFWGRIFHLT